ncbi:uncharacterized protein LOC142331740 isoform X2 [Lycorma delicatula]|uniref:uncharacterized protein LOC142331740 isoform X2 n=1 Tax=Lycorma delicatula TaxID=130591 RepID=UPI003F50D73F
MSFNNVQNLQCSQSFDINYVFKALKDIDKFLIYMKNLHPSQISVEVSSELNNLFEKSGYLLSLWEVCSKRAYFDYKIEESLWGDHFFFKYLYEDCITYCLNNITGVNDLYCMVCEVGINSNTVSLIEHVTHQSHLHYFNLFSNHLSDTVWKNMALYKHAFEKYINIMPNKTLYCKICGITVPILNDTQIAHFNSTDHWEKFISICNFKFINNHSNLPLESSSKISQPTDIYSCSSVVCDQKSGLDKSVYADSSVFSYDKQMQRKNNEPHVTKPIPEDTSLNTSSPKHVKSKPLSKNDCLSRSQSKIKSSKGLSTIDFQKHNEFMREVIEQPSTEKLFCQPCEYYALNSSIENIAGHINSLIHQQYSKLKVHLSFMTYSIEVCKICNVTFFCTSEFFLLHTTCFEHKKLSSDVNNGRKFKKSENHSSFDNKLLKEKDKYDEHLKLHLDINALSKKVSKPKITNEKDFYGYYCKPCKYWTEKPLKWTKHTSGLEHNKLVNIAPVYKLFNCDCSIAFICDYEFRSDHLISVEHENLKRVISQKLTTVTESSSNISTYSNPGSTSSQISNNSNINKIPLFKNENKVQMIKTYEINNTKYSENKALHGCVKALLKKFVENLIEINDGKNFYGYYCKPCKYWAEKPLTWNKHTASVEHNEIINIDPIYKSFNCGCCICFICDDRFYSDHLISDEHKNLKSIISQKLTTVTESSSNISTYSNPGSTSSQISNNSNINKIPLFKNENKVQMIKTYEINNTKYSENKTLHGCVKALLKKFVENLSEINDGKNFYGYYCKPCKYWAEKPLTWNKHTASVEHNEIINIDPIYKSFNCGCCICFICDDRFYSDHLISDEHKNLKSIISQKLTTSVESSLNINNNSDPGTSSSYNEMNQSIHDAKYSTLNGMLRKNKSLNSILPLNNVLDHNIQVPFQASVQSDTVKNESIDEDHIKNSLNTHSYWIGLKGLSADVSKDDIISAFKDFEVVTIKLLESDMANLYVRARDNINVYRMIRKGEKICIKGELYPIRKKNKFRNYSENECGVIPEIQDIVSLLSEFQFLRHVEACDDYIIAEHDSTNLKCKIFYKNDLVIENTDLISLYVNTDDRVKTLILFVKEWAYYINLPDYVSNYAITWMVLYYLMQVPLVKPVSVLMDSYTGEKKQIADWNVSFAKDPSLVDLLITDCSLTIDELAKGFFSFYGHSQFTSELFDSKYVHCTLTGETITKSAFLESGFCNARHHEPFNITDGFNLQDPLEGNKNLTENLKGHNGSLFGDLCKSMLKILS